MYFQSGGSPAGRFRSLPHFVRSSPARRYLSDRSPSCSLYTTELQFYNQSRKYCQRPERWKMSDMCDYRKSISHSLTCLVTLHPLILIFSPSCTVDISPNGMPTSHALKRTRTCQTLNRSHGHLLNLKTCSVGRFLDPSYYLHTSPLLRP